jgi:hypothetical protein
MLAAGTNLSIDSLRNAIPVCHYVTFDNVETALPAGYSIGDVLNGNAGWTEADVRDFRAYVSNLGKLHRQLESAVNILPRIANVIANQWKSKIRASKRQEFAPTYVGGQHGYAIGYFDVLGFESRLYQQDGLALVESAYKNLSKLVKRQNENVAHWRNHLGPKLGHPWAVPFICGDGDVSLAHDVFGVYASDSFCFWMDRNWPESAHTLPMTDGVGAPIVSWAEQPIPWTDC